MIQLFRYTSNLLKRYHNVEIECKKGNSNSKFIEFMDQLKLILTVFRFISTNYHRAKEKKIQQNYSITIQGLFRIT